jgi:hypothetical protein
MGMSSSIPLYVAAARRPLVLQLGPSERTTIFWNYKKTIRRVPNVIVGRWFALEDRETYAEGGVSSGISWRGT